MNTILCHKEVIVKEKLTDVKNSILLTRDKIYIIIFYLIQKIA